MWSNLLLNFIIWSTTLTHPIDMIKLTFCKLDLFFFVVEFFQLLLNGLAYKVDLLNLLLHKKWVEFDYMASIEQLCMAMIDTVMQ